jgi:hypothetical protein
VNAIQRLAQTVARSATDIAQQAHGLDGGRVLAAEAACCLKEAADALTRAREALLRAMAAGRQRR